MSLEAQSLAKSYKKRQVVKDVSISVEPAQIVGLLGPNGAGKTTCFYMIVGLVDADGGLIRVEEKDITRAAMHERARSGISYLPQEASIFRKLTVKNNLLSVLEINRSLTKAQRLEKVDELLEEFHITHIKDSLGMSLSGGERRRVEIARAIANEPKYILLDEPFAGVDPISVSDIKQIISHLKSKGIGVLITDHNVRETLDICEKAYIVSSGEIIAEGSAEEVLDNAAVRKVYLGSDFRL